QQSLSDSSREAQRRPHRSIRVWAVLSQDDLRGTTVGRIKLDTPCNARFRRIDQNDLGSESLAIKDGGEFDRLSVLQAGQIEVADLALNGFSSQGGRNPLVAYRD